MIKAWGMTGGVGMGKSTSAQILRRRGVPVIDTDELARQLVQPGESALDEILAAFGEAIVDSTGHLHRSELARIVFADGVARKKLESILHPRIRAAWLAQIETSRQKDHSLVVVVIPLLFETQSEIFFDKIVCVACSAVSQNQRLHKRSWTMEQIQQRNAAQWPMERKIEHADFVIWTEGVPLTLEQQWEQILKTCELQ